MWNHITSISKFESYKNHLTKSTADVVTQRRQSICKEKSFSKGSIDNIMVKGYLFCISMVQIGQTQVGSLNDTCHKKGEIKVFVVVTPTF